MIGQTLGSYRVISELGQGGMGTVYLAEHPLIGRNAAIKVLQPRLSDNKRVVERFFNEARAATLIKHRGIVDIFDFGYAEDGSAFIVMEYLEGQSLTERIAARGIVPEEEVVRLSRQVASALAAAHDAGIIHRDLKPDNVFIIPDREVPGGERVKVLDFGIAKLTGSSSGGSVQKTRTGAMMGSPLYMAPEQCRGAGDVDERADVYALGCVMFQMACGQPVFLAEGVGDIIAMHIREPARPVKTLNPQLADELAVIIDACLQKDPSDRFASMNALSAALEALPGGRLETAPPHARPTELAPAVRPAAPTSPSMLSGKETTTLGSAAVGLTVPPEGGDSGRRTFVAIAGIAIAGGAVAAFLGLRGAGGDPGATAQPELVPADAQPVAAASLDAAPEPAAAAAPATVRVRVDSDPPGAEVYRKADGLRVGRTPFDETYPRGAGELVLLIKKSGYRTSTVEVSLAADSTERVELVSRRRPRPAAKVEPQPAAKVEPKPKPEPEPEPKPKPKPKPKDKEWGATIDPLADD